MNTEALEQYNANYVGGAITGGVTDLGQLFTRPVVRANPYSTPNPDIFICSASTPPVAACTACAATTRHGGVAAPGLAGCVKMWP